MLCVILMAAVCCLFGALSGDMKGVSLHSSCMEWTRLPLSPHQILPCSTAFNPHAHKSGTREKFDILTTKRSRHNITRCILAPAPACALTASKSVPIRHGQYERRFERCAFPGRPGRGFGKFANSPTSPTPPLNPPWDVRWTRCSYRGNNR